MLENALTVDETAKNLDVSSRHIRRLIKRGELPSVKIGRLRRILPKSLEDYLHAHETGGMERVGDLSALEASSCLSSKG